MSACKILSVCCLNKTQYRNISFRKVTNWYASLSSPRPNDPPYTHVTQIGDPILRVKCETVPLDMMKSKEMDFLIKQMKSVIKKYDACGLAAPQIGISLRVFAIEFSEKRKKEFSKDVYRVRKMSTVPFTVFINPRIKIVDYTKISYPEACESVKGFCADVPRYSAVEIRAMNENGDDVIFNADGWTARIIQHEMDHLDGKIYTDIMDKKTFCCTFWQAINERRGKVELGYTPS